MFDERDRKYFYDEFKNNGYQVGSYDDFKKDLSNKEDRDWYYNEAKSMGYDVGTQADFDKMVLESTPSTPVSSTSSSAQKTTQEKQAPKVKTVQKPQAQQPSNDEGGGLISNILHVKKKNPQSGKWEDESLGDAAKDFGDVFVDKLKEMPGRMISAVSGFFGGSDQNPQEANQSSVNSNHAPSTAQHPLQVQGEASPSANENAPATPNVVNNEDLMDDKFAKYLEDWKKRPSKDANYFDNFVADLEADGMNPEDAIQATRNALNRYANRSALDVTNKVVSSLPDDTVQDAEKNIEAQWYSHGVQDKLKQEATAMGVSYDDYVAHYLKPAMVESLVRKYGQNYRNIAEGIATRLYSHEGHVQDRLMNQDIDQALSDVIGKYVNPSVVDEYMKAQKAGSEAFNEGMEGSQYIPANLRLGTVLGAQYEANQAKDPQKALDALQKKFSELYKNPQFLTDMANAAYKVMQGYGMNGGISGDPKQFKPMIDAVLKNQLDQLEVKKMIPKGSAEYIMNTGLGNTIVGKITRKFVQTDYQNWLEDIANQQYQPGFWERVGSGALTFAGDAWSYWLPGAAGGKLTKSMLAKAEGRLAGDLMAKGMETKMAERAAKVLIGKSKSMALKTGAVHGAVTFGGQSAISKPIDEIYRTGQFDENGKVYNPSVGKILANTLGEVVKQSAVGAIMQGGTIANMVGKGRGLATNVLADVGGKVVDSGIMTGQQMLERMAHDPNFKPTGKDAAESFLESMANLTSIGLPGIMGKYARFKDAKEFNRKFDFNDQDIAELKRFGYDDLRDAFEKLGINGYRAEGEGVQMMGQLTDKYMNLMDDKRVPEVLKAKMMAVVEGKRPSSFSPVIDSIIVQPMDHGGKVYLETLNKDGGIIDRKEYSSLDEARKAEKKLDFEKSLNITSEYEKAYHTDALQDRLNTVYEQAREKYAAGEQLNEEDKTAIYLHQNAGAIGDIMQKQQKGMELTEQEQQMVNSYRHFYDSAFENSPIMKEYVRTFEDSKGVEHGTLRKALEGDGKSRTAEQQKLVEEYQKQLYNDIVLKREMNDAKKQMSQNLIEGQRELPGTAEGGSSVSAPYQDRTKSVPSPSAANSAANLANSSAEVPSTEPTTPPVEAETINNSNSSDAYVMGKNAYQNGDADGLKAIDHNDDVSKARLKRAFADDDAKVNVVVKAYEEGKDMEQFVAQRANSMSPVQQEAVRKYVEAQDAKKGVYDALQHADDGYGDALKEQLWPYQTEDGNIVPATLTTGQQVFLKKANEYGGGFVVVPGEDGNPTIKQFSKADIKEVGAPIPLDDYVSQKVTEQKNDRLQQFFAQYDGSIMKPSDTVEVAMEAGGEPMQLTFAGYGEDGKIVLSDGKDNIALTKDEFNAWRQNALEASIGAELDAEDAQRANDEAAKAEAEKKQRFTNGIVGYENGKMDYSSKESDSKVVAEYLQDEYGEDHGKLMNLISGSRSDIKEQLDNKRKVASEYEEWLSINADLDPGKAQKVENDLALVNEQIADLETRYRNWNTIRKEVMTPEEAKTLKNERKAEIEKAGVDESVISPLDDREVAVLDNKELKKQYPTMDEANSYIASERKRIYHIQNDEVQPQIDGINEALEQYMSGDVDYSADQLKELSTTKAQLEARQANLSASAKDLKTQAKLLNTLYSAENKEASDKVMETMAPSEQRKALVADAFKKNDLGAIKEIYKDASIDVTDLTPQTLEEAVSEALHPHILSAESLQSEFGKGNFNYGIGKGYDSNKYNYLLAKKGSGLSVKEFAVKVFNDLPVNLWNLGYTDQDVRNTLLDMLKSYDSVKEMRNVALMNRIAAAEDELSSEEEYYEAQKEREIMERQAKNKEYVKSILPELADYDDRSNEEGYGGGGSLGSHSSRRESIEGNRNSKEGGSREASAQTKPGAVHNSTGEGRQENGSMAPGEGSADRASHLPQEASFGERLKNAIAETEPNPSEAQKKAGNYKKGHLSFGGYDFTVETPKGTTRSGKDEHGKPWSVTMYDTYGYILGKIGVDGDHIDMFINDGADLDSFDGNVYVVDQVNPETGVFDEHKVMYGYPSEEAATEAYLANYSKGWKGLGKVTSVPKTTFDKWLESSDRKTKPFADYAMIKYKQDRDEAVKKFREERKKMQKELKVNYNPKSHEWIGIPEEVITDGKPNRFGVIDGFTKHPRVYAYYDTKSHATWLRVETIDNQAETPERINAVLEKEGYKVQTNGESSGFVDFDNYTDAVNFANHVDDVEKQVHTPKAEPLVKGGKWEATGEPEKFKANTKKHANSHDVVWTIGKKRYGSTTAERDLIETLLNDYKGGIPLWNAYEKGEIILSPNEAAIIKAIIKENENQQPVIKFAKVDVGSSALKPTRQEEVLRDAVIDKLRENGMDVITDVEEGQRVLDAENGNVRQQAMKNNLSKAANIIKGWISNNKRAKSFTIELPVATQNMIRKVMGRDFDSHNITSDGIRHGLKNHGVNGKKLTDNSIPIRDEDAELVPYIMTAPDYVRKGSTKNNRDSVRFYKTLENGYVVVVEKEFDNSVDDMETINIWGELSDVSNAKKTLDRTSETPTISRSDAAKIRKDAETAIENDRKMHENAEKTANKAKYFVTPDGEAYGYTVDGKIYIDPRIANSETPIHEYAHLWAEAVRSANPKEWENIVNLMKGLESVWDKVKREYPHLKTDSDIADEVLAQYSGKRGSERLRQEYETIADSDESIGEKAKAMYALQRLKKVLDKFWKKVADFLHIHFTTAEEVADRVMKDLLDDVDPRTALDDHEAGGIMFMGSTTKKRMKDIASKYEGKKLSDKQKAIIEAYSGKANNTKLSFTNDGQERTLLLRQGNDNHAGTKHSLFRHYGTTSNFIEAEDLLKIPEVLEKGNRKESDNGKIAYVLIDPETKVKYTVVTDPKGKQEYFNDFYTNKKAKSSDASRAVENSTNTPEGARKTNENAFMTTKVDNFSETAKENVENLSDKDKEYQFYANRYGTEPEFISQFDEAMQTGNVQLGHWAMANIRRAYRINHSDMKLSMFAKMFTSVKNELYSRYGNLDEMQKKYEEEVFADRNVMEAAQKRAEEEKAKKQKHLDELSLLSDEELDKRYMDAIGKNDEDTAREMLDESARRKGYGDVTSEYQGQGAWAAPSNPHYESDEARRSDIENSPDVNLEDMAMGYNLQPDDYFDNPRAYMNNTAHGLESSRIIKNALDALKRGEKNVKVKVYRAVPTSVKEGKLRNGDWVTPSKKYAEMHGNSRLEGKYRIIEDEVPANQLWWDGNDANEFGFDDGKEYKYKNAKNNRKLNDLLTRDDKGNIIPPSQRFNSRKKDIRFMFAGEKGAAEADKAEEQTNRMDNLDVANKMEVAKKDAKAIKLATGWERAVDGKWRYEMPDAKIKDTIDVGGGHIVKRFEEDMLWTDGKLEDAVDAPKLFEAYPQLKNIKIHTDAVMNDMPSNGEYNPQTKTITIHADELKYLNSILNHEIQHVIQHEEGFAHGGTPEQVERDFNAAKAEWKARSYAFELEEKAKEMGGEYNQSAVEKALIQEYKDMDMPEFFPDKETRIKGFNYFARGYADRSMDDAIKRFRLDRFQRTDFDSYQEYRKLAGEVEARNVQKRMGMTDEERRNSLASETEDVDRGDQIVMDGDGASYSIVKDPEEIERLNKEKTFRMYSGMQDVDGKLYSPMAAIIDGKRTDATEIGAWMVADERPDLVKKGKFQLVKTDKKPGAGEGPVPAAYNPYMHTSTSMMNDQFTGAYARGNIKVVEWEIPESELTSGYHAEGAKNSVGLVPWHSGSVNSLLPKDRQRSVMLSRWRKAVRVVPDSEVAESIAKQLEGTDLAIPWNVVTPNQLEELVKLGVPITTKEVGNQTDEVRAKFLAQKDELEKKYPQAKFVDVQMTKEAYKKWGKKTPIVEEKLTKHPKSLIKAGTYFSGGGLVEEGLKGIIDPVVAVEYDQKISGVYRNNFGQHIVTADVRDVDPKELMKHIDGEVEYFHASPVCKNFSQAKANGTEVELDKETAKSTADFINAVKPRVVTIENVKGYRDSEAMKIITNALDKNGYKWDADVYNAADYGGYTNRERLIVRAVKNGNLPAKPKKQPRKGGWLEAVEDILPTLTEKPNGVAPWMDARLKADGIDWQKVEKPLYVMGSAYAEGKIPHAYADEKLPTLRTKSGDVIIMPGGKVLRADGRVLARVSGMSDDYKLPSTESLAHTIIGNGIPTQLTKAVIAPLLNKDDLSGRNILNRLGKSIFKNHWNEGEMRKVADSVVNAANQLGGASATAYTSLDEVPNAYLSDVKKGATGWYDPETHTVHVYLPNCVDVDEAQRTVFHEKIGHEGMEVLLGGEQGVRKFADFVYKSVGKETRGKILDFANKYDKGWQNPDRINIGTQEYIAHLAEEGPQTAEDFSLWTKIKHYIIKILKKLGIRVPGLLNDKDLRYYLMKAGKALHVWDNMPKEKQEAMMAQASNTEIKDALSEGAGKGKPRQKKGESTIQYMKRVMEWRRWKEAREDTEDPEPPMFYDFDKDAEGKKEWERLNKEWRDSHGLKGEEMPLRPERKEGESDEDFMSRYKEWEKWNTAMGDKEKPMPDMFAFEKQKQAEVRQKYEDWLTRHELNEQQQADLDLYEGKIYPAETNPEADALEQRVMQDLAEVTSTDVSKEGAAKTVKYAVIHRRKNIEEASADDAIYINDVKNRIEKMANSGAFDKLLSDYQGKPNKAEKLSEVIPFIIEAPRRLRDLAKELNNTGAFDKGHIHIQPADVEAIQPFVEDLAAQTSKKHTELKNGKEVEVYNDPQAVSEVASKMAQAINKNHQGEEDFVPIDGTDILGEHVLPLVMQQIVPKGIDYKNLSPEMKATIDSIRDWYNYTYDWLKDNNTLKADTGYNVDYVNHIWDKEKSDKQAYAMYVENRQRTKSPNEKPRTISTLMEGINVGLVPKTTDITKMMAYYSRSNIEPWANKTMLQEVSGLNVIERNENGEIISSDPLLSSTPPFNLEQYKYFEIPGVGPVWIYNVSPKQVKVTNPITGKDKVFYSEASAGSRFGVVFDTYQSTPFWKFFDTTASSMKKLELGFSGFHAGALTEVYMVQNMVEFGPKKALANFMKYIFADTMKNHELPCFANPEDFQEAATHLVKFGATNDYAAADVQNMFDNFRDSMMKVQEKLGSGNVVSKAGATVSLPFKVASQMLSLINKGMDRALWDFLHDGLKLATYNMRAEKTKARAKEKGWTDEQLSKALDEDGQFVNDMFGGQHWDVLGASHRTLRYAGRVLLSPDWNASTTRHFLALTGYGSVWNEATLENFKEYYKRLYHKNLTPEDEGRRARQISSLLCYGLGFMVFYEGIANGINAAFRALDEEKERKKAEEIRKTNPNYRSPYELAYGDEGMKWYDYLMRGNSLGQQSKIFMGRYADGTEMYIRHGKQFREVPEYLFNHKGELEFPGPMVQRMIGKANPMVRMTLDDINYLSDFQASHADQEIQRKYGKTIGLLYKDALYWAPFLIPSQENKEFKAVDFFFPSSKGFSPWKAQSYFKDFILSGDMEGVAMTYQSCERNGIDPEAQIKAAIGSVKALESAEMKDGITSLQVASERFDEAKSITEKKKLRQKMKKFLSQSEYKAFTQKEALDMVQSYLNGKDDLKEMEKAENKYLMKAKSEDVTEDWRIQVVWNGTMETYDEYQRLKDVDKARANAFKNSKTNKRLFDARKAISAARKKMNKAKKQMDGQNDAAKMVEIRKIRKELLKTLNGME